MKNKYNPAFFDTDEKNIIAAYEEIDLKKINKTTISEQVFFRNAAKNFIKKEKKMNIRIENSELENIKKCAQSEGLKYSTFVKSIIHKYISGQLIERKNII